MSNPALDPEQFADKAEERRQRALGVYQAVTEKILSSEWGNPADAESSKQYHAYRSLRSRAAERQAERDHRVNSWQASQQSAEAEDPTFHFEGF